MQTTETGQKAEAAVARLLKEQGYKITDKNWRTKVCEIDLIALKDGVAFFVEVKYRAASAQGDGFEYITAKKLKQMTFAAEVWVQQSGWRGDWRLMAAAVSGLGFENIALLEI